MRCAQRWRHFSLDTPEIVRRLLSRPVTATRARKLLHLLESPEQLPAVLAALEGDNRAIVGAALSESVVQQHFARRGR